MEIKTFDHNKKYKFRITHPGNNERKPESFTEETTYPTVIIVCFDNSYQVPYTDEGVPSWGSFDEQTAYYKKDIDLTKRDFSPVQKVLDPESIIRLRNEKMLQMRLPSGIWCDVENADIEYVQENLEQKQYHMFRTKKS